MKAKFYAVLPLGEGHNFMLIVWITWPRWPPCQLMVKTFKIFARTNIPMILKFGMDHYVLKLYKVYVNYDPELTLTYFTAMSFEKKMFFEFILDPGIR